MTALAVTNTLSNGATILASDHNTNYSDVVTYINNRNSGSATWDALSVLSSSIVPLVVNNSSGTQDIARFQDNGANALQILDGGIINMGLQSAVRVYRNTSTQSLSGGANKIQFNGESYDTRGEFDSSTNYRFTATATGKYLVAASVNITSPSSGPTVSIYVNGALYAAHLHNSTTSSSFFINHIAALSATNYLEIYVTVTASGTVNNGSDTTFLSIHKIA